MTSTDYRAQAEQVRAAHDRQVDRIRDRFQRKEITAELRDTLIARNLLTTKEQLGQLREAEHSERVQRRQALERRLFSPAGIGNDPATRATAYRQARAEAAKLGDEGAIREALRDAVRADDRLMQKAIFEHAHNVASTTGESSLAGVIVSYLNTVEPTATEPYRELVALTKEETSIGSRFAREAAFLVTNPREVERYQDHHLAQVAADPRFNDAA